MAYYGALLKLHEKINIPALLNNSESWHLNKGEETELEKIEIQALKYLFDLPLHTPTPAIHYTFGTFYTKQRVDHKQLTYLHKVLNRKRTEWTKKNPRKTQKSEHWLVQKHKSQKRYMVSGSPCPLISFIDIAIQLVL